MTPEEYSKFMEGKKVVLVGPASYMDYMGDNWGENVDSFDVVVKVNANPMGGSFGSRTDVLYFGCGSVDELVKQSKEKNPDLKLVRVWDHWQSINHCDLNISSFRGEICSKIKSRPNTGFITILHLLSLPIETLLVTGMDFHRSGYAKDYLMKNHETLKSVKEYFEDDPNGHRPDEQYQYFKNIKDERLCVDHKLKEIMEDESLDNFWETL